MRRTEVVARAPAKVNLYLGVGPVRPDGFHPLATVYQAIGLYDEVTVSPSSADDWRVSLGGDARVPTVDVPTDESNLALRAARLLAARHGIEDGVHIRIDKGIPVAAGLAGGSADAAAALVACDALWETRTPREELLVLAAELGSDVPFGVLGGTAIGAGRGEILTPAMVGGRYWWVVLESERGLSTPAVYREFDLSPEGPPPEPAVSDDLMAALRSGDVERLGAVLLNDLQPAALRLRPELEQALSHGLDGSAHGAIISGSGPTCLFLAEDEAHARRVAGRLRQHGFGATCQVPAPVAGARVLRRST